MKEERVVSLENCLSCARALRWGGGEVFVGVKEEREEAERGLMIRREKLTWLRSGAQGLIEKDEKNLVRIFVKRRS